MDYLDQNGGLGLTGEQTEKVLEFQNLTGIEDIAICRDVLARHSWNLEVAVQEQLNIREGRPSVYAVETRPPQVVSDDPMLPAHSYYAPPTDGSGSGLRGVMHAIFGLLFNVAYTTVVTFVQIARRMLGIEYRPRTDPVEEVMEFIRSYEDRYGSTHPVFYQGTFSQALNDAKRELRFLLVYLHDADATDTELFCRSTLSNRSLVEYVNAHFLFWGCSAHSDEGRRTMNAVKCGGRRPFLGVLVLKEGHMTIVGRLEGHCEAGLLVQRLRAVVQEFDRNLVQARADRVEASINRSLRQHQDEAFMESLRADQEKERRREEQRRQEEAERLRIEEEKKAEEARRLSIKKEKIESVHKVPEEPDSSHPDVVHVVFKLPCGSRLDRRFLKTHSLEHVFYFVFCHPEAPDSFEITTNFPKRVLPCRPNNSQESIMTLEQAGLKTREVLFVNDLDA
ncbi:FAS-associated factor 2 [Aethina tumida]|uniref:FAS-associated factor 2 n=1 Tax=Aethina tumida TaxID=116153 RepID=UPI00096AF1F5|nr:FAS-associated factor 2 [Aethina tumida]